MSKAYPGQADWHPSFIIIGAVKAATTWALEQLQVNPALYMPDPEPHYFSSEFDRGEDYYRAYFEAQAGSGRMWISCHGHDCEARDLGSSLAM
mgnify:CR=1 FL=1